MLKSKYVAVSYDSSLLVGQHHEQVPEALQLFSSFQFKETVISNIKWYGLTFENYDLQGTLLVFSRNNRIK